MIREEIQRAAAIFAKLQGAVRMEGMYPPRHPQILDAQKRLLDALAEYLTPSDHLTYAFLGGMIFVEGFVLPRESLVYQRFAQFCQEQTHMSSLTFLRGVTVWEIEALVQFLHQPEEDAASWATNKGLVHVKIGHLVRTGKEERELLARGAYRGSVQILREIEMAIRERKTLDVERIWELRFLTNAILQQIIEDPNLALRLASIKSYDEHTLHHSVNVCVLSIGLGVSLNLPESLLRELAVAAILHDVGKVALPLHILQKSGPLNESEWRVMRQHPVKGADILSRLSRTNRLPMIVAAEHHIRYDGGGYPPTGEGWQSHPFSQIIAIADVYDSMTTRLPYKQGVPTGDVLTHLREEKGKGFDPDLVDMFELILSAVEKEGCSSA